MRFFSNLVGEKDSSPPEADRDSRGQGFEGLASCDVAYVFQILLVPAMSFKAVYGCRSTVHSNL